MEQPSNEAARRPFHWSALAVSVCLFVSVFAGMFSLNARFLAEKSFHMTDEYVMGTVSANLTRRIFPPMVRINPLVETQGLWLEGPYWQHIPPLFTYFPLPLFWLEGKPSIEMLRLTYALTFLLSGIIFIVAAHLFRRSPLATISAGIAASLWAVTPFAWSLLDEWDAFNDSEIVLAFFCVIAFAALCWYLSKPPAERGAYPPGKLILVALACITPVLAKSALGAIPAALFVGLLVADHRTSIYGGARALAYGVGTMFAALVAYFGALYLSAPSVFMREIMVPFYHLSDYEGWARPWYFFITDYLPERYLSLGTGFFILAFVIALVYTKFYRHDRKDKILLYLTLGWFAWNLIAVSVVSSKAPNFIFQSYLFALFFAVYGVVMLISRERSGRIVAREAPSLRIWESRRGARWALFAAAFASLAVIHAADAFQKGVQAAPPGDFDGRYYRFASSLSTPGGAADLKDIYVLYYLGQKADCPLKYYLLFEKGSEAKTLGEFAASTTSMADVRRKYDRIRLVVDDKIARPELEWLEKAAEASTTYADAFEVLDFKPSRLPDGLPALIRGAVSKEALAGDVCLADDPYAPEFPSYSSVIPRLR